MPEFKYEVVENYGSLSESSKGWKRKSNLSVGTKKRLNTTSESGLPTAKKWVRALL